MFPKMPPPPKSNMSAGMPGNAMPAGMPAGEPAGNAPEITQEQAREAIAVVLSRVKEIAKRYNIDLKAMLEEPEMNEENMQSGEMENQFS